MTVKELKNMSVKIRGYVMLEDNAPFFLKRCMLSEAYEIMKDVVRDIPKEFCDVTFYLYTEDEEHLFTIQRDLEDIYFGRENKFKLTRDIVREAMGIVIQPKSIDELVRTLNEYTKVSVVSFPDLFNDYYHDYIHHCALKDTLQRMDEHLDELELDEIGRLGYIFSVLLIAEGGGHRLIYSYDGDRNIRVRKEFEGILSKLGIRDSHDSE